MLCFKCLPFPTPNNALSKYNNGYQEKSKKRTQMGRDDQSNSRQSLHVATTKSPLSNTPCVSTDDYVAERLHCGLSVSSPSSLPLTSRSVSVISSPLAAR